MRTHYKSYNGHRHYEFIYVQVQVVNIKISSCTVGAKVESIIYYVHQSNSILCPVILNHIDDIKL